MWMGEEQEKVEEKSLCIAYSVPHFPLLKGDDNITYL